LCPELEASLKRKALNDARGLDRVDRHLRKLHAGARIRIAREQIAHLRGLNRQIEALHRELAELVSEHRPRLLEEQGCGALTAAILIGHTAGNERFRSEASFAKQTTAATSAERWIWRSAPQCASDARWCAPTAPTCA
jgi:transposase